MYNDDLLRIYHRSKVNPESPMSANFRWIEWFCRCGKCEVQPIHHQMTTKLEELRAKCGGLPMTITSGYRCPDHNHAVGGAAKSRHMTGDAADVKVRGVYPKDVALAAKEIGFRGIKTYRSWTHVDLRPGTPWYDIK